MILSPHSALTAPAQYPTAPASESLRQERVLSVAHRTDRLFTVATARDPSLRFRSGQFTMICLHGETRALLHVQFMTIIQNSSSSRCLMGR
jgi:hypothetical protein